MILTSPDPPSKLRQLAYAEGNTLMGPDGDPTGWKVLAPVKVKGTLFNVRECEVECTVSLTLISRPGLRIFRSLLSPHL